MTCVDIRPTLTASSLTLTGETRARTVVNRMLMDLGIPDHWDSFAPNGNQHVRMNPVRDGDLSLFGTGTILNWTRAVLGIFRDWRDRAVSHGSFVRSHDTVAQRLGMIRGRLRKIFQNVTPNCIFSSGSRLLGNSAGLFCGQGPSEQVRGRVNARSAKTSDTLAGFGGIFGDTRWPFQHHVMVCALLLGFGSNHGDALHVAMAGLIQILAICCGLTPSEVFAAGVTPESLGFLAPNAFPHPDFR